MSFIAVRRWAARLVLLLPVLAAASPQAAGAAGVEVVSGVLLRIDGRPLRLWGVRPPEPGRTCRVESAEPCGAVARRALDLLIGGHDLACTVLRTEPDGTMAGRCTAATADLGLLMVRSGWALDDPHESAGFYAPYEEAARTGSAGLWALP